MILHKKNLYGRSTESELKSYHKTDWANCWRMQGSWLQLKSDSISWRKTLKNSHNSQIQWLVVSSHCQETKILNRNVGFEGTPRLDPHWKLELVAYKVNTDWKLELNLSTKNNSHSWVRISHGSNRLVIGTWTMETKRTTSRKPQKCSSRTLR